ncbi:MAG: AraC-like DNA-binding protein [Alteromonadaceae bacterium]|jgi:AraC-like DNA-binding protein
MPPSTPIKSFDTIQLGLASTPAVNQYLAQAEFEGIATAPLLDQLQIDSTILHNSDRHITGNQFQQLINLLLKTSANHFFGLHSSRFVRPDSYHVLGDITMNCRTFAEVLAKIQPFEQLVGDMGVTRIQRDGQFSQIQWFCQYTEPEVIKQMVDNCLASWLTFTRQIIGQQHSPHQVLLRRPTPSLAAQQQYQRCFNCTVLFNQKVDALVIKNQLLNLPVIAPGGELLSTLEARAQQIIDSLSDINTVAQRVAIIVAAQLPHGLPLLEIVAQQLNISAKTLQRRLKAENTRYIVILNEVRLSQASSLLNMPGLSLIQISEWLGFGEPRSFYRWFKQLTGTSPRAFCQNQC